ncbi:MAG: LTA synthase family protein [Chitinophagaceae bacterium]|nr:LTA synthase family protein [Chitinophagaceae bacterium]
MIENASFLPPVYGRVLRQFVLLLLLSQVLRLLFFLVNRPFFDVSTMGEYLQIVCYSLRFDLSSLFTVNLLYVLITLFPAIAIGKKWIQHALQGLFIFTNSVAFIADTADIAYFPYVRKRMTADVFDLMGNKSDFLALLPNYLTRFWLVSVLILLLPLFLILLRRFIFKSYSPQAYSIKNTVLYLSCMALALIAVRGGLQLRPVTLSNSAVTNKSENIPLIINTPFSLIHSVESQQLSEYHFFSEAELSGYLNPIKNYRSTAPFRPYNVVVIILESFGKGFTGIGGRQSYAPFLDSLMQQGMTFTHAFANATRSADGIPAVLSGIPYFMNESFPFSAYATNQMDALPSLLKQKGYSISFFHGGANGTMNFDSYCKTAGFDQYVGRSEYNNDLDYGGTWGIWDEPFLQYFGRELNRQKQPFFSSVFTLSSHEPFAIPESYNNSTLAKLSGIQKGIAYTDRALQKFFQQVSHEPWFNNTLFVITADHNYLAFDDPQHYYNQGMGLFSIPVIFYKPNEPALKAANPRLMQQIDIMPSVLDYLHFEQPFFSFGKSVFDSLTPGFCCTAIDEQYFFLQPPWLMTTRSTAVTGLYHFEADSLLQQNRITGNDSLLSATTDRFHAYLQLLHSCIIHNRQSVQTYR